MPPLPKGTIASVCRKNGAGCGFVYARIRRNGKKRRRNDRHPPDSRTVGKQYLHVIILSRKLPKTGNCPGSAATLTLPLQTK
ncbi:hypothetical protein A3BBH6_15860 [Alistipes onderdonkii subsp. vulgaris]|nr:hypothetical protein A3BBH6_15860 [Alistipes onderdonkii subsp. vulgaris]